MDNEERVNDIQVKSETDEFTNNQTEKPKRKRKTKEEQLNDLNAEEAEWNKLDARKKAEFAERRKKLTLTPEEKRKIENHCRIIAGITAFELYSKGKPFFTRENFKNRLYNELTDPISVNFLNKSLKEKQ